MVLNIFISFSSFASNEQNMNSQLLGNDRDFSQLFCLFTFAFICFANTSIYAFKICFPSIFKNKTNKERFQKLIKMYCFTDQFFSDTSSGQMYLIPNLFETKFSLIKFDIINNFDPYDLWRVLLEVSVFCLPCR